MQSYCRDERKRVAVLKRRVAGASTCNIRSEQCARIIRNLEARMTNASHLSRKVFPAVEYSWRRIFRQTAIYKSPISLAPFSGV
jgi:hypothetical protein